MLGVGVATSVAIVAAWFPASDLLHQRSQLDSASAALAQLDHENTVLRREAAQLRTKSAIADIARQQYGLVTPGVQAYQVLPASGEGDGTLATAAGAAGAAGSRPPGAVTSSGNQTSSGGRAGKTPTSGGFVSRVVHTLEFWR